MSENEQPDLSNFEPSWLRDGIEINAEQRDYSDDDNTPWETQAQTFASNDQDFGQGRGTTPCALTAGDPPETGTYVLGAVDGVCQWIDTTTCS